MKNDAADVFPPPTLMVWTITDEVIEHPETLQSQFDDIMRSGFGGVAVYVRCSRYSWYDPPARAAFRAVGRLCRRHGMECWLGPDPRFVSRQLIGSGAGMDVLLFGDKPRADRYPNFAPVEAGRFSVRCSLEPRHVHTLNEVAIEYYPRGLARVYAVRYGPREEVPEEILDVTSRTRYFYNARSRYVEAFGNIPDLSGDGWRVLPFFLAGTSHVDYSNPSHLRRYLAMLDTLKKEGCVADAIMWDEAGYTCTYGTLPYTPAMLRHYRRSTGKNLGDGLWQLALPSHTGSHTRIRCSYYAAVQKTLNEANAATHKHIRRLWGPRAVSGIHDTWHFESADMCDMNHGSLDLWQAVKSKSGGFVDLGGIDQLRFADAPWYAHLATLNVICASLGKVSSRRFAYNNLWTVGDDNGEGWQATVMDHCVDTMAIFGLRWMAHAYGPVGTIGEERTFLGSPELPGYPRHSTWPHFPQWIKRLNTHCAAIQHRLPESHLLVVYPIETMYALAGPPADAAAAEIFRLVLALVDHHYHIDVQATSLLPEGRWEKDEFVLGRSRYRALVFPYPEVVPGEVEAVMRKGAKRVFCLHGKPRQRVNGRPCSPGVWPTGGTIASVLDWLGTMQAVRPLLAPPGSWGTITPLPHGTMITLCPSRHAKTYAGPVQYADRQIVLPESRGLTRVFFPGQGDPVIASPQQV